MNTPVRVYAMDSSSDTVLCSRSIHRVVATPTAFAVRILHLLPALLLLCATAIGQTASWTFGTTGSPTLAGTSSITGVTANNAAYGPMNTNNGYAVGPAGGTDLAISSRGFNVNNADVDRYFEVSVTVAACKTLTLTQLSFDNQRGSDGPPPNGGAFVGG